MVVVGRIRTKLQIMMNIMTTITLTPMMTTISYSSNPMRYPRTQMATSTRANFGMSSGSLDVNGVHTLGSYLAVEDSRAEVRGFDLGARARARVVDSNVVVDGVLLLMTEMNPCVRFVPNKTYIRNRPLTLAKARGRTLRVRTENN